MNTAGQLQRRRGSEAGRNALSRIQLVGRVGRWQPVAQPARTVALRTSLSGAISSNGHGSSLREQDELLASNIAPLGTGANGREQLTDAAAAAVFGAHKTLSEHDLTGAE